MPEGNELLFTVKNNDDTPVMFTGYLLTGISITEASTDQVALGSRGTIVVNSGEKYSFYIGDKDGAADSAIYYRYEVNFYK